MRNRLFGLTMVLAFVGQNAHSAETGQAVAGLNKETPYAEARLKLLSAGWSPAPQDAAQSAEERCGARTEICEAYPETDACSGTGMGFCAFRFRDEQGSILAITTVGEELADLTIYDWRAQ